MAIRDETENKWAKIEPAYNTNQIDICRDGFNVLLGVLEKHRKDLPPEEEAQVDAAVSSVREFFQTVVTSGTGVVTEGRIEYSAMSLADVYELEKDVGRELFGLLKENGFLDVRDLMSEIGYIISASKESESVNREVYREIDKHLSRAIVKALDVGVLKQHAPVSENDLNI